MFPDELKHRKKRMQRWLGRLAGGMVVVKTDAGFSRNGAPYIIFESTIRISEAKLRFHVWEQFLDVDTASSLHAFSYHVGPDADVEGKELYFRYECHPDIADDDSKQEKTQSRYHSPYETVPHFHPDRADLYPISKLHFPFHREERGGVVFALASWIHRDLLKRFYATNRIAGMELNDD